MNDLAAQIMRYNTGCKVSQARGPIIAFAPLSVTLEPTLNLVSLSYFLIITKGSLENCRSSLVNLPQPMTQKNFRCSSPKLKPV